jgi:hypothetical protein
MKPDQNKNWLVFPVMDWRLLPLLIIGLFYFVLFRDWVGQGRFPLSYGTDYLAFWSLGKISNEQGYSHIYDLDLLLTTQTQ